MRTDINIAGRGVRVGTAELAAFCGVTVAQAARVIAYLPVQRQNKRPGSGNKARWTLWDLVIADVMFRLRHEHGQLPNQIVTRAIAAAIIDSSWGTPTVTVRLGTSALTVQLRWPHEHRPDRALG